MGDSPISQSKRRREGENLSNLKTVSRVRYLNLSSYMLSSAVISEITAYVSAWVMCGYLGRPLSHEIRRSGNTSKFTVAKKLIKNQNIILKLEKKYIKN